MYLQQLEDYFYKFELEKKHYIQDEENFHMTHSKNGGSNAYKFFWPNVFSVQTYKIGVLRFLSSYLISFPSSSPSPE